MCSVRQSLTVRWSVLLIDASVVTASYLWFLFNATLPDVYRGKLCCDSVEYVETARSSWEIGQILTHYEYRTLGYPLFLHAHLFLLKKLGFATPDDWTWVHVSLYTVFIFFVCTSYFLYNSFLRRGIQLHRVALYILLLHPGLLS
jgi:hypothetical protein